MKTAQCNRHRGSGFYAGCIRLERAATSGNFPDKSRCRQDSVFRIFPLTCKVERLANGKYGTSGRCGYHHGRRPVRCFIDADRHLGRIRGPVIVGYCKDGRVGAGILIGMGGIRLGRTAAVTEYPGIDRYGAVVIETGAAGKRYCQRRRAAGGICRGHRGRRPVLNRAFVVYLVTALVRTRIIAGLADIGNASLNSVAVQSVITVAVYRTRSIIGLYCK